jgi:hypothetical protein
MIRSALLAMFLLAQDDAAKTLADPAKRADEVARRAAADAYKAQAAQGAAPYVAWRFLSRSEKDWKLDAKDPGTAALNAHLQKYGAGAALDEKGNREACDALQQAVEKNAKSDALEALRLFQLAHLSALGDKGAEFFSKLAWKKEGDRWGKGDLLALAAVAKVFQKPAYLAAEAEKTAKGSPMFAPRYVMALLEVQKAFSANAGFEAAAKAVSNLKGEGAPPGAVAHVKALADSLKAAVYCGQCQDGKLQCDQCGGKKKLDLTCDICHGIGWAQKPGSAANTLIKCGKCFGQQIFRNTNCPTCKATGLMTCQVCGGKPWRDGFKGCKDCKACSNCKGRKETVTNCAGCDGKGRSGGVTAGIPTILCTKCQGNAIIKTPCAACNQFGLADCGTCGGKGPRDGKSPARPKPADVWDASPCELCGGSGWPLANLAVPCDRCVGLGVRLKPKSDPAKLLE